MFSKLREIMHFHVVVVQWRQLKKCTKKGDARATRVVLPIKTFCFNLIAGPIGPLQLAIHVVQNRHVGEQKSHRDKTNKRHT